MTEARKRREWERHYLVTLLSRMLAARGGAAPDVRDMDAEHRAPILALALMRDGWVRLEGREWLAEDEITARFVAKILLEREGVERDRFGCLAGHGCSAMAGYLDGAGKGIVAARYDYYMTSLGIRELVASVWIMP